MTAKVCLHTKTYENLPKERFTSESSNKPPGLICKNEIFGGGLFSGGGAYSSVGAYSRIYSTVIS